MAIIIRLLFSADREVTSPLPLIIQGRREFRTIGRGPISSTYTEQQFIDCIDDIERAVRHNSLRIRLKSEETADIGVTLKFIGHASQLIYNTITSEQPDLGHYDSEKLVGSDTITASDVYVDLERIREIHAIKSAEFDISKLIELCEELNKCYSTDCRLAVAMLVRAILDHVPPIFSCRSFAEVINNYSGMSKSVKQSMRNLESSLRHIADAHLHSQIRKKETLPSKTQVNFSNDLDVLLSEIVRALSSG